MNGCRACLKIIPNDNPIFYLGDIYMDPENPPFHAITIKEKLADCVPELLLDNSEGNDRICKSCVTSLMAAYLFRQRCLQVQREIHDYIHNGSIKTELDIGQIAVYYKNKEIVKQEERIPIDPAGETTANDFLPPIIPSNPNHDFNVTPIPMNISIKQEPITEPIIEKIPKRGKIKCNSCDYTCRNQSLLKRHKRAHNPMHNQQCLQCDFRGRSEHALIAHMKSKHGFQDEPSPLTEELSVLKAKRRERKKAKRERIKEDKRLLAQMPPILVITPKSKNK